MAYPDSMFLVEIKVKELKSYVSCRDFVIKTQFADVFSIVLQESKREEINLLKPSVKKRFNQIIKPSSYALFGVPPPKAKVGHSVIFTKDIENLISNMKKYPMELSLWCKTSPEFKIASTNITWSPKFIEYLKKLNSLKKIHNVLVTGDYNVFDEITSKRMAVIKLDIKLSYIKDGNSHTFSSLSTENLSAFLSNTYLSNSLESQYNITEDTGIIKTKYSGRNKTNKKHNHNSTKVMLKNVQSTANTSGVTSVTENINPVSRRTNNSVITMVKSETDTDKAIDTASKTKSCYSIQQQHLNILNYILDDHAAHNPSQVYCVNYFTVENVNPVESSNNSANDSNDISQEMRNNTEKGDTSAKSSSVTEKSDTGPCKLSFCSSSVPQATKAVICKQIKCDGKKTRKLSSPPSESIFLDLSNRKEKCCIQKAEESNKSKDIEKVEEIVGGMNAKLKFGEDPCYCECECRFGFVKKTTYCNICKGFEKMGDDLTERQHHEMPFPCPIYHKLEKVKTKTSATGSDGKKVVKKKSTSVKSVESKEETKKSKKKKKDDKFKFNYGYTGIPPQIGHSRCALPCNGTLNQVPKRMGWLWTADNIPGMKFRPLWKPGAVNRHVLRLLRMAKHPGEVFTKKKRKKVVGKAKRPLKRPLLVVHKKNGEFTVTMETMKTYSKPRAVNQVPYEDKPALTYTIGRTDEENRERRKKKERAQRRLERCQRKFIQSAFNDMCEEICLKTYQQALGILPDAENPDCTCYPAEPGPDRTDLDYSCSCSEDSRIESSDTDSDEWVVEFTPPSAKYDQSYKCKKIQYCEMATQYTYLDYRVKLLDHSGNPVPRFFTGPDGKQQCSDLGGFWNPDHVWLEINIDGYIAPDGKWAPNIFVGPNGENVDAESGKFQTMDGTWLVVGIDGYVDSQGKWCSYPKQNLENETTNDPQTATKQGPYGKKEVEVLLIKSKATFNCYDDASPQYVSKRGTMDHEHDRKLLIETLKQLIAQGLDAKMAPVSNTPRCHPKKTKRRCTRCSVHHCKIVDEHKCKHSTPSDKGVLAVDADGNKTYFKIKDYKNRRPRQRIATLTDNGISVSSFHVPCFHSFISREIMKKEQYDRLVALAKKRQEENAKISSEGDVC